MKTQNILIPTDFSLESLNAVTGLLQKRPDQKFNISLVHFMQLSDSITELLMLARRNREYQYISAEFETAMHRIRKHNPEQVALIHTEFFYGSTVALFKNYLEAKDVDMIVTLQGHTYAKLNQNSIDPTLLLLRSGCTLFNLSSALIQPVTKAVVEQPELELEEA